MLLLLAVEVYEVVPHAGRGVRPRGRGSQSRRNRTGIGPAGEVREENEVAREVRVKQRQKAATAKY